MSSAKKFDDVIVCPICTEKYNDPRVLPCGHTCCFSCIERWRTNQQRQPGQSLSCPYCRKEFIVPRELAKNYSVMNILEKVNESESQIFCDQHQDEKIKIYCADCKMAMCTMCFVESHNGHKFSNVCYNDLQKQMANDVINLTSGMEKCREMLEQVEKENKAFTEQLRNTETEINTEAERLKQMIDAHRVKLVNELSSMKQKRMNEMENLREEIETQLLSMESYKMYVDDMRQKETACAIAIAASGLHDRANKLLMTDDIERKLADLGHADVTYTSLSFIIDDVNKTLGHLRLNVAKTCKSIYSYGQFIFTA